MEENHDIQANTQIEDTQTKAIETSHLTDPGWSHCTAISSDKKQVRCNYCGKEMHGGINRLKAHIARLVGEVKPCPKVPTDVSKTMKDYIDKQRADAKKRRSLKRAASTFGENLHDVENDEDNNLKRDNAELIPKSAHIKLPSYTDKNARKRVCSAIARWFYHCAIPFNSADSIYFARMCESIGTFGTGFKAPTPYEIFGPLLNVEVELLNDHLKGIKSSWNASGCTIMSDGWTAQKNRSLINFLVSCPRGTMFIRSIDASEIIKDANNLFKMLDAIVVEVGQENVIQVVTDNAANYVAAGRLLMAKRPNLFWTSCAAHSIDLVLEKIGKLDYIEKIIEKAKKVTKFVYNHTIVLSLMRKFTDGRELLRPATTRFATHFILIESIIEQKVGLKKMFLSEEWSTLKISKTEDGQLVEGYLTDSGFWKKLEEMQKISWPLVKVLRLVDGDDKPAIGYLYDALEKAKIAISEVCGKDERKYKQYWDIIDDRWNRTLKSPLHLAGYFLNPAVQYALNSKAPTDVEIRRALQYVIRVLEPNLDAQIKALEQVDMFIDGAGEFGTDLAIQSRTKLHPVSWWRAHGLDTPDLQRIAIRILSQNCSSSGCERNWSTFDQIYTKKRNKLKQEKLDHLVFVHYNMRLREKQLKRNSSIYDPIDIDNLLLYSKVDEWLVDEELQPENEDLSWLDADNGEDL